MYTIYPYETQNQLVVDISTGRPEFGEIERDTETERDTESERDREREVLERERERE
jgi:hypothetical protein